MFKEGIVDPNSVKQQIFITWSTEEGNACQICLWKIHLQEHVCVYIEEGPIFGKRVSPEGFTHLFWWTALEIFCIGFPEEEIVQSTAKLAFLQKLLPLLEKDKHWMHILMLHKTQFRLRQQERQRDRHFRVHALLYKGKNQPKNLKSHPCWVLLRGGLRRIAALLSVPNRTRCENTKSKQIDRGEEKCSCGDLASSLTLKRDLNHLPSTCETAKIPVQGLRSGLWGMPSPEPCTHTVSRGAWSQNMSKSNFQSCPLHMKFSQANSYHPPIQHRQQVTVLAISVISHFSASLLQLAL